MKTIIFLLSALCLVSGIHADDFAPAEHASEEVAACEEIATTSEEVAQEPEYETTSADQDNTYSCHCHKKGK